MSKPTSMPFRTPKFGTAICKELQRDYDAQRTHFQLFKRPKNEWFRTKLLNKRRALAFIKVGNVGFLKAYVSSTVSGYEIRVMQVLTPPIYRRREEKTNSDA